MSTSLAIQKNIQPPPTKTEVVDALVQLRREEWIKRNESVSEELKKLTEKLERHAFKLAKKQGFENADVTIERWQTGQIVVCFKIIPELAEDFANYKTLIRSMKSFDEKEERNEIRAALNGSSLRRNLLSNADTRKKLVGLATEIGIL